MSLPRVFVSAHATERAAERAGLELGDVVGEVLDALEDRRLRKSRRARWSRDDDRGDRCGTGAMRFAGRGLRGLRS
jgi:hypothetical protein